MKEIIRPVQSQVNKNINDDFLEVSLSFPHDYFPHIRNGQSQNSSNNDVVNISWPLLRSMTFSWYPPLTRSIKEHRSVLFFKILLENLPELTTTILGGTRASYCPIAAPVSLSNVNKHEARGNVHLPTPMLATGRGVPA